MEKTLSTLSENDGGAGSNIDAAHVDVMGPPSDVVADIIARGARDALETEASDAGPVPGPLTVTDVPRKRRGRKPKQPEPTPEEAKLAADMAMFFSADGIGQVWVSSLSAFYAACNAAPLNNDERGAHANAFAAWARVRMPASSTKYQPELLLLSLTAMTSLPRIQPIAQATAPLWKRLFTATLMPFRRKKAV